MPSKNRISALLPDHILNKYLNSLFTRTPKYLQEFQVFHIFFFTLKKGWILYLPPSLTHRLSPKTKNSDAEKYLFFIDFSPLLIKGRVNPKDNVNQSKLEKS